MPVTDEQGHRHIVMTQTDVDETTLHARSPHATGGEFFRATDTASLEAIYARIDALEKTTREVNHIEHHEEELAWRCSSPARRCSSSSSRSPRPGCAACREDLIMTFAQPMWLWIGAVGLRRARVADRARRACAPSSDPPGSPRRAPRPRSRRRGAGCATVSRSPASRSRASRSRGRAPAIAGKQTPRRGVDLMFAVDTSKSMRAADLAAGSADARQARGRGSRAHVRRRSRRPHRVRR